MVPWKMIADALKCSLSDWRSDHAQLIADDVHIRTLGADLKVHLRAHLDASAATWHQHFPVRRPQLNVDAYINRNHNGDKKRAYLGESNVGTLQRVLPAFAIHDRESPDFNILAAEHRDALPTSRYHEIVHCKRRVLSYLKHPLYYEFGLFLQYDRKGRPIEATLLKRETLLLRGEAVSNEMRRRFAKIHKRLKASCGQEEVVKAKAEVAEIEYLLGVENVVTDLCDGPTDRDGGAP